MRRINDPGPDISPIAERVWRKSLQKVQPFAGRVNKRLQRWLRNGEPFESRSSERQKLKCDARGRTSSTNNAIAAIAAVVAITMSLSTSLTAVADEPVTSITGDVTPPQKLRAPDGDTRRRVAFWIDRLGDESYLVRQLARNRLEAFGLEAFDQLHDAQFHPDMEIEMAARYLVSSLLVGWSHENDPQPVKDALEDYGTLRESERGTRLEMLAGLPDNAGTRALARLARFETSLKLSQEAALAIINTPLSDTRDPVRHAEAIIDTIEDSNRTAAQWLMTYAEDLQTNHYDAERWQTLIAELRGKVARGATNQAWTETVLRLVRASASHAIRLGHPRDAEALAMDHLDLVPPKTSTLLNHVSWAIDSGLHRHVLAAHEQFRNFFDGDPLLLYAAAEAASRTGGAARAEALAKAAGNLPPLPTKEDREKLSPKQAEERFQRHRNNALTLIERGLFQWAESELKSIIEVADLTDQPSMAAREDLAQMYADMLRHQDVVDTLAPLVDRLSKDDELLGKFDRYNNAFPETRSMLRYHEAELAIEKGDAESARQALLEAYALNPPNIDILIRMHRLDGDAAWRSKVDEMLSAAIRRCESEMSADVQRMRMFGPAGTEYLASRYNQYAWLVCNTDGDLEKALRYSLKSLELSTDFAKLDTCARCYFALGQYDKAIATQKRALQRSPHQPALKRQLEEFEKVQAAQRSESTPP